MATYIQLKIGLSYDYDKTYAEQSEPVKEYCELLSNYTSYSLPTDSYDDESITIREYTFNRGIYQIVKELQWNKASGKYIGERTYARANETIWHYPNKIKRCFIGDDVLSKAIGADSNFATLVNYVLSPDPNIDPDPNTNIEKIHVNHHNNGWYVYFSVILPEHEYILTTNGINVQTKV